MDKIALEKIAEESSKEFFKAMYMLDFLLKNGEGSRKDFIRSIQYAFNDGLTTKTVILKNDNQKKLGIIFKRLLEYYVIMKAKQVEGQDAGLVNVNDQKGETEDGKV